VKNRYLTIALALGSCLGVTAMAQDQQAPPPATQNQRQAPDPARQAQRMAKRLGLTADQQSQLVPILANRDQQVMALRSDTTLSPQDRHAKMMNLRQDSDAKIKAVLTDAQKQQYDEMRQQHRGRVQPAH
jgi:Spy/CpxP family protein refolding chaperone